MAKPDKPTRSGPPSKRVAVKRPDTSATGSAQSKAAFPIVGIGCSAGGLEALEKLLSHIPARSGMAFVIVQHLDPVHASALPELLQRVTTLPVAEAAHRMAVKPDCVYIIPPNKDLSLLRGKLHLSAPVAPRGLRLPIDFFLRTLAEEQGDKAVGIILIAHKSHAPGASLTIRRSPAPGIGWDRGESGFP